MRIVMVLVAVLSALMVSPVFAEQKMVQNRVNVSKKNAIAYYFKLLPVDISRQLALSSFPKEMRPEAESKLTIKLFESIVSKELEKHFTAEEIITLADFYGGPVGKKIVNKYPAYLLDVTEAFKKEMIKLESRGYNPIAPQKQFGGMSMVPDN